MNSGGLTYEETLPAHAEGMSAYGKELPVDQAADGLPASVDRGKDLPLVFTFFALVIAAYGAIGYAVYVAASAVL